MAFAERAPLDVRVNALKAERATLNRRWRASGWPRRVALQFHRHPG